MLNYNIRYIKLNQQVRYDTIFKTIEESHRAQRVLRVGLLIMWGSII